MASTQAKITIDHEEIKQWVQERGGHPAMVKDTSILRFNFPGYAGADTLDEIGWEEFFEKFEKNKLALLYQEKTADGKPSRFNKLVKRRG